MQQVFIDQFIMPEGSKAAFMERMTINRNFIKTLPGFQEDAAYERTDGKGNFVCLTVAIWQSPKALEAARVAVTSFYKKEGFNMQEMMQTLGIGITRDIYTPCP